MKKSAKLIDPDFLLQAYAQGIFPMGLADGEIGWFSPDPRGIIPLDAFHVPHGLTRFLKRSPFEIRINTSFREVMLGCANRPETWIDDTVLESYCCLHRLGFTHCVETWQGGRLVGGLYGVAIGGAFFGESMFSRCSNASGAALVSLVARLRERAFMLLDTQWTTRHLRRFGAVEIPRSRYMNLLNRALDVDTCFHPRQESTAGRPE